MLAQFCYLLRVLVRLFIRLKPLLMTQLRDLLRAWQKCRRCLDVLDEPDCTAVLGGFHRDLLGDIWGDLFNRIRLGLPCECERILLEVSCRGFVGAFPSDLLADFRFDLANEVNRELVRDFRGDMQKDFCLTKPDFVGDF